MSEPNAQRIFVDLKTDDPFARVPKSILDDARLSWKAKGILSDLLGKPSGWKLRVRDLANRSKDGEASIRTALKELREAGYVKLIQMRNTAQEFAESVWNVSDAPIYANSPDGENPQAENPQAENRHCIKKESSKNDSIERHMAPSSEIADEIYEAYPRKAKRPNAIKAIQNALKRDKEGRIRTAAIKYGAMWAGVPQSQMTHCPHPATWFNAAQYNDDPGTWQKPDPKGAPPPSDPGAGWDEAEYMAGVRARKEAANE